MNNNGQRVQHNIAFWAALGLLIIGSYGWRLAVFNIFPFSYDEGIHLILGQLWAAGHIPYQEIFVSYPPSFMWSLGIPWTLFNHPAALQLVMSSYALAGVLAVVYLGTVYHSRLAGLVAGLLLSFTPAYFISSFSIMTEVPSISLAVVGVALAEKYRRSGDWGWALFTGVALGLGLSLKILPYYAVPLAGLMVITRHGSAWWGQFYGLVRSPVKLLIRDLAILTAGFIVIFFVPALFYNTEALYQQVVGMRLVSRAVEYNPFDSNHELIIEFLFRNAGLTALALYGLVFMVARDLRRHWLLLIWLGLIWVAMILLVPLRDKHLPIFVPVLALFAGFAVSHIVHFLIRLRNQVISPQLVAMVLAITITLGMFIWSVPGVIAQNNGQTLENSVNEERQTAIAFINQIATPNDCIIADNPVFLYQTHRLPPPELSETSQTRIDTGYLTTQDVIRSIQKHRCHIVAVVTPRFGESLPGLKAWLAENYLGLHAQSETYVYFAKIGADDNYTPLPEANFNNLVQLYGFNLETQSRSRGKAIIISLYWQLISPVETNYIERITLRANGKQYYQTTRLPFDGFFDPAKWQPNQQARDSFWLDLPDDLPTGNYDVYLSLCGSESNKCATINNQRNTELFLGQFTFQSSDNR